MPYQYHKYSYLTLFPGYHELISHFYKDILHLQWCTALPYSPKQRANQAWGPLDYEPNMTFINDFFLFLDFFIQVVY